jgi:hypothetical protein
MSSAILVRPRHDGVVSMGQGQYINRQRVRVLKLDRIEFDLVHVALQRKLLIVLMLEPKQH